LMLIDGRGNATAVDQHQRLIIDLLNQSGKKQLTQSALRQRFEKHLKIMKANGVISNGQPFQNALKDLQR